MVWGKRESQEFKKKRRRSQDESLQCIERDFWDGDGFTGWSVRWDYCPVSASHTHSRTHSKHTPPARVNETTRVKTQRERERKQGWLIRFLWFPECSPLYLSLLREAGPRLVGVCAFMCVWYMSKYKSKIGQAPPTLSFPSIHPFVRPSVRQEWCCGPLSSRRLHMREEEASS